MDVPGLERQKKSLLGVVGTVHGGVEPPGAIIPPEVVVWVAGVRAQRQHASNNGTYWCHYTIHDSSKTARRVRVSLETKDINEARQRRDAIIKATSNISTKVPWPRVSRGQAMPDVGPDIRESRAVRRPHGYWPLAMTH